MRLLLQSGDDLRRVERLFSSFNRPHVDHVVISVPWLAPKERERLAAELKARFNDCGCLWATTAFALALIWCAAAAADELDLAAAGYAMLASTAAALVGKLLGLFWSRWRLKVLLADITPRDEVTSWP